MILTDKKFENYGISPDRTNYRKLQAYAEKNFINFAKYDSIPLAFERFWVEYEPLLKQSEIEFCMICLIIIKLSAQYNYLQPGLTEELIHFVKKNHIIEKYKSLLPADEYEDFVHDLKKYKIIVETNENDQK